MSNKPTGLAAFARKPMKDQPTDDFPRQVMPVSRTRGKAESVALTVRLTRQQWERVHQLALAEGISLQQLIVSGLAVVFRSKGLPDI